MRGFGRRSGVGDAAETNGGLRFPKRRAGVNGICPSPPIGVGSTNTAEPPGWRMAWVAIFEMVQNPVAGDQMKRLVSERRAINAGEHQSALDEKFVPVPLLYVILCLYVQGVDTQPIRGSALDSTLNTGIRIPHPNRRRFAESSPVRNARQPRMRRYE